VDTFKFPIRFANGGVEKFIDGTDEYYSHLLALVVQIQPADLPLNPQYGVTDPTFSESLIRDLALSVGGFIPEIIVENAEITIEDNGESRIDIAFSQRT
jgi:hypothetical protein